MNFEKNIPYIQKVYTTLKEAIILNQFAPGQVLNERDLSTEMNISRTPLRDGLNLLESEGWIVKNGNKRVVSSLEFKDVEEIYEVRMLNESYVIKKVAEKILPEEIEVLYNALIDMEKKAACAEERYSFMVADMKWHQCIWSFCGNSRLIDILYKITEQFVRISLLTSVEHDAVAMKGHHEIFDAISRKQPEASVAAYQKHIESWYHELCKFWKMDSRQSGLNGKQVK